MCVSKGEKHHDGNHFNTHPGPHYGEGDRKRQI